MTELRKPFHCDMIGSVLVTFMPLKLVAMRSMRNLAFTSGWLMCHTVAWIFYSFCSPVIFNLSVVFFCFR